MALKQLNVWTSDDGSIVLNSAESAVIGTSMGAGAAQFGQNAANPLQMGDDGNLNVQVSSAGISPGSTGNDNVLAVYQVPIGALDIALRGLTLLAAGNAPNTNAKTIKMIVNPTTATIGSAVVGGTTVASITATGAGSSGGWQIQANLFKYGAAGSNTQITLHETGQIGSLLTALTAPTLTTLNESALITIAITGNATTAVGDIVFNFFQAFGMN